MCAEHFQIGNVTCAGGMDVKVAGLSNSEGSTSSVCGEANHILPFCQGRIVCVVLPVGRLITASYQCYCYSSLCPVFCYCL